MPKWLDELTEEFDPLKYLKSLNYLVEPIPWLQGLTEKIPETSLEKNLPPLSPKGLLAGPLGPIISPKETGKQLSELVTPLDIALPVASKLGKAAKSGSLFSKNKALVGIGDSDDLLKQLKASITIARDMKKSGIEKPQVAMNELKKALGGSPSRAEEAATKKAAYEASKKTKESVMDKLIREASESVPDLPVKAKKAPSYSSPELAQGGLSVEEGARKVSGQKFYLDKPSGLTYLGNKPDASLKAKEGVIILEPGKEPALYSGHSSALERFKGRAKTEPSLLETKFSEEPETYVLKPGEKYPSGHLSTSKGERGSLGKALPPPKINLPGRFKLTDKLGEKNIRFASDFDRAAYQLTRTSKPNTDLLLELQQQTGLPENVILRHARKLEARINSLNKVTKTGQDIQLYTKNVEVPKKFKKPDYVKGSLSSKIKQAEILEEPPNLPLEEIGPKEKSRWEKIAEGLSGLPSELAFMLDLPLGRQSFRAFISHPFRTGLPALRDSLRAATPTGFEKVMAELGETPTGQVLAALKNIGEGNLSKLLPNVGELRKLPVSDLEQFFSKSSWGEKIPGVGELAVKPSKRMYEAGQFRTRINELERILGGESGLYEHLVNPDKIEDLASAVKRVSEETGYGRLPGVFDRALEAASYGFTAPRNVVAKAQFYNPMSYLPKSWGGRFSGPAYKDFLIDQAKIAALIGGPLALTPKSWTESVGLPDSARLGAVGYLSDLAGADVESDPFASNFGIRYGNYKPDIMGGEAGIVKTVPRIFPKENETRINAQGKEFPGDPSEDLRRFVRSRIRPGGQAMLYDVFQGYDPDVAMRTNFLGENLKGDIYEGEGKNRELVEETKVPYAKWALDQITPSWPEDIYQTAKMEPAAIPAAVGAGFLGFGGTSYDPDIDNPYRPAKKFFRLPVKGRAKRHYEDDDEYRIAPDAETIR